MRRAGVRLLLANGGMVMARDYAAQIKITELVRKAVSSDFLAAYLSQVRRAEADVQVENIGRWEQAIRVKQEGSVRYFRVKVSEMM